MRAATSVQPTPSAEDPPRPPRSAGVDLAERVREAIEAAGLTLYQVEAQTRSRRHSRLPAPIPHTLYRDIRAGQTPSLAQLVSLSEVTQQPIHAWLAIVGIDLSTLPAVQTAIHAGRTIRVAARSSDQTRRIPQWERWSTRRDPRRLQRLVDVVEHASETTAFAIERAGRGRFHYLSVGAANPWLAPELTPGSLVRVDPRQTEPQRFDRRRPIYAVAHAGGLSCCYAERVSPAQIALFGSPGDGRPALCRAGHDAIVLGRVDTELRVFDDASPAPSASSPGGRQTPPIALPDPRADTFGRFLRRSRALIGLTFRDARELTERVAERCGDSRFRLSLGALCNYETLEQAPSSPHALFSLAAVYAMDFWDLPGVAPWRSSGHTTASRETHHAGDFASASPLSPWMQALVRGARDVPLWLAALNRRRPDVPPIALTDLYVWGSGQKQLDPRLEGALVIAVDRRDRRLAVDHGGPAGSPLFVLRLPNDACICCSTSAHDSCVLVHPAPALGLGPRCLPRANVDVIGRVSAVLRRLNR
jgi:hypothetical protein